MNICITLLFIFPLVTLFLFGFLMHLIMELHLRVKELEKNQQEELDEE